jgi:hypothetical protein
MRLEIKFPSLGNSLLAFDPPPRGFMQIDAPSSENVSLAPFNLAACFYPENTGLVDFVAKYFSLSDQRQLMSDKRPRTCFSTDRQTTFHRARHMPRKSRAVGGKTNSLF